MKDHVSDQQLIGYVNFTLTDAERESIDQHLQVCADCRGRWSACESLERRIRYSLAADFNAVSAPSSMTFAVIDPRLRRRRWWDRFRLPSGQLLPGVTALAGLVGLAVALIGLFQNLGWSQGTKPAAVDSSFSMLACGCFAISTIGHTGWKRVPIRDVMLKILALIIWLGTAIVGLQVILVLLNLLMWLSTLGLPVAVAIVGIWPLCVGWIVLVVGGGEHHYQHLGQASSWRLFGWTIALESFVLATHALLKVLLAVPSFLG